MSPMRRVALVSVLASCVLGFHPGGGFEFEATAPAAPFLSAARHSAAQLQTIMDRLCKDHDEQCAAWAAVPGECERNRDFMWARCQGSCKVCMIDNLMSKSFQELALYSLRNAVRSLADTGPSNRALAEHQQPLQAILHRLTVTPVVTNAHLPKLLETLHAAAAELQALMLSAFGQQVLVAEEADEVSVGVDVSQHTAGYLYAGAAPLTRERTLGDAGDGGGAGDGGLAMPRLAFGTWELEGRACYTAVAAALRAGIRHIDTAQAYQNEAAVGEAWMDSGLERSELFLTTKLSVDSFGTMEAAVQLEYQLDALQTEYVDLYLLHGAAGDDRELRSTWAALEEAVRRGKIRHLGVSNLDTTQLAALLAFASVGPSVVQNKLDVYHQGSQFSAAGEDMLTFCAARGIAFMGYAPLHAWPFKLSPLADRHVAAVAARTFHTPAQVLLRWALQRGGGVVTRSSRPAHIAQSARVFDFSLSAQEMLRLDGLAWFTSGDWNVPRGADVYGVAALAHTVCADASEHCPQWAAQGECATNPGYMGETCAKSCDTCGRQVRRGRVVEAGHDEV